MDQAALFAVPGDYYLADAVDADTYGSTVPHVAFQLRGQKSRIIANWALRVASLPAFRAMPNLALNDVERHIPQVLESVLIAISTSDPTMDPGPLERAVDLAGAHGRARLLDDFTVGDVLSEFNALRREVWSAFWRLYDGDRDAADLPRAFASRLGDTFDAVSVAASEAWVSAKLDRIAG